MGGLLHHLFEFNHTGTSRKLLTHKKHADGFEAPRNSLELPIETFNHQVMQDNLPYMYQVNQHSKKNFIPSGTPMKKLINDEMSKPTDTKRNAPSVVARLMGMDVLPMDMKPVTHVMERGNENTCKPNVEQNNNASSLINPFLARPVREVKHHAISYNGVRDADKSIHSDKLAKPQPREHPQEEQLQKFKKEFEAWQASKVWERSRSVDLGNNNSSWIDSQILAQENLNREKMVRFLNTNRYPLCEKALESIDHTLHSNRGAEQRGELLHLAPNQKEATILRNKTRSRSCEYLQTPQMNCYEKETKTLPTKIVILKPAMERSPDTEELWPDSSEVAEEEGSIEEFLEEVKERLRFEIQGGSRKDNAARGCGSETPLHERVADPREIARHIAKHVRESVTRDLGMSLLRSESTRSYRSEVQFTGQDSPEFINHNTRRFLSERLRNVLRDEIDMGAPSFTSRNSFTSVLDNEVGQSRTLKHISKNGQKLAYWEHRDISRTKTGSFRHEQMNDVLYDRGCVSPRNLMRSLSAPVSRTSFGKLLLEEPRILTGAQIRRKHEASEILSVEVTKTRKERFSFRGKVSNLRHSFTLRGKLFGKKVQSVEKSRPKLSDATMAFMTAPSVLMNMGIAQENSTEVPPSPASVCSSANDEFLRLGDHSNPVYTLDAPFAEDQSMPKVPKDVCLDLHDLRGHLNQLNSEGYKAALIPEEPVERETINIETEEQAYIRDILVASGLLNGSSPTYSIDSQVFEQVEEAYMKNKTENERALKDNSCETKVGHKVLFDLLNEALSTVVGRLVNRPRLKRGSFGVLMAPLHGKRLFNDVWRMICVYVHPSSLDGGLSLEGMIVNDVRTTFWKTLMDDEIECVGKEMECMILGELIEEATRDLC